MNDIYERLSPEAIAKNKEFLRKLEAGEVKGVRKCGDGCWEFVKPPMKNGKYISGMYVRGKYVDPESIAILPASFFSISRSRLLSKYVLYL